ncbi:uncharacterized protein LOC144928749 isoform X1 [Branchiostoma floridae x Branchiostoma belcheri]
MASVGRNSRKDSGIFSKKNTPEKGKATKRLASTIMETDDGKASDEMEQEQRESAVTRGKLNKSSNNKMTELKNKMKKKIKEKKLEISDPRSRVYSGNSSFVRKKLSSLKVNNRELASTLAAARQSVSKLSKRNLSLQQENMAMAERVVNLQGRVRELQAALRCKKDNEQEYKKKMSDIQSVLQKVSSSLLGTVEHIGSAMEVCHPALRDSGWRMSSLSAHVSVSDNSDGALPPVSRPSVLGAPVRVPLPASQRQSLAPPGSRAARRSVSVPPPPPPQEPQESSVAQAGPRDSIAALQTAPILFTDESRDSVSVTAHHTDTSDKPQESSSLDTTEQEHKKDDKRRTYTQAPNTSRPSAVPVTEDRRSSTLNMPPPVNIPSKSTSGQNRRGTYSVPTPVPVSTVVHTLPCDSRRGTYTVPTTLEVLPEGPEKRLSLMDLVAEHKRKSQDAAGHGSCPSNESSTRSEMPAEAEATIYSEEDMDLTTVPATVISTEETEQATEDASKATNAKRPGVDKDAERSAASKKGKTSQKDLNQSGCKPVRRLKKKKASKLPTFTKSAKSTAERREEVEKDGHDVVKEARKIQEVPSQEVVERPSENVEPSQESEAEVEEFDADDTTVPKPTWALQQEQQIIPEDDLPSQVPHLADNSDDDDFVNKRGRRATRRIVSTDSETEFHGDMITGPETSAKESSPEIAVKKKKQKSVAERNVRVSAKMTKKGLVVQSTSTKSKTFEKDVDDTTPSKSQEKTVQESLSVFDLSSGDMFSDPSPLTLKPVMSREHASEDDDHQQSHSHRGKPKKHAKLKQKQSNKTSNKKRQNVIVSESSDEEDIEEENNTRRGKTSKKHRDVASIPESPRQSDEGQIARPRRKTTAAVKYFSSDSESEDDCWQNRKSKPTKRNSSNYSISEEEENTGTQMPLRQTPQRLLRSAEKGPLSARKGKVFQDSSDNDTTTPIVERALSKRRAFQDVGNTPQGHRSDTTGTKTKVTPQTGPKNQKKRPFSSVGSCEDAHEQDVEQSHSGQNENGEDESAGGPKRARRSRQQVSYKEPTLNSKLRRGDPMTMKFGDWSPQYHKHKTGKKINK